MRVQLLFVVALLAAIWAAPTPVYYCPVTGQQVNMSNAGIVTWKNGQQTYFCCSDCVASFVKDPLDYVNATAADPVPAMYLGQTVLCPVSGMKVVVNATTTHVEFDHGQMVFFCCDNCKATWLFAPNAYIGNYTTGPVRH